MFIALHDHGDEPRSPVDQNSGDVDSLYQQAPGLLFDNHSDYVFWAFLARHEMYRAQDNLYQLDGTALQRVVLEMTHGWHPRLRQLVGDADPATIIVKPLQTARPIKSWATRPITLLGDAIHSMPPTRGIGGNTALRDAELLCRQLVAAQAGQTSLLQAVHTYETEMRAYGFAAVRASMQALQLHVADSRLVSKLMLRSVHALFALRRFVKRRSDAVAAQPARTPKSKSIC
jgi:2-polyprenyl-6-methoxyphenol hydroxylase-like FAD-dependent oxidoreductase